MPGPSAAWPADLEAMSERSMTSNVHADAGAMEFGPGRGSSHLAFATNARGLPGASASACLTGRLGTRGFGVKGLPGAVLAPGAMELSIAKHAPMLGKALKGCL